MQHVYTVQYETTDGFSSLDKVINHVYYAYSGFHLSSPFTNEPSGIKVCEKRIDYFKSLVRDRLNKDGFYYLYDSNSFNAVPCKIYKLHVR